nr:delta-like protein 1 [Lytechinus pictus]
MQTEFVCACQMAFSGTVCEIDNPCYPNPCLREGICSPMPNGGDFMCDCPPSYGGKTCDNLVSPCHPDPCTNGGTCYDINLRTEFYCACASGFKGIRCEEEKDVPLTTESMNVTLSSSTISANTTGAGRQLSSNVFLILGTLISVILFKSKQF